MTAHSWDSATNTRPAEVPPPYSGAPLVQPGPITRSRTGALTTALATTESLVPATGGKQTRISLQPPTPMRPVSEHHPHYLALVAQASMEQDWASQYETPTSYHQATTDQQQTRWRESIKREIDSLQKHKVFTIVHKSTMPPGARAIRMKWVFRVKQTSQGLVSKFKSRLTACGYSQRYGRDFKETFSPVCSAASIRMLFALTAHLDLTQFQFDIGTAFLHGILPPDEQVYLQVPEGINAPKDCVLKCVKAIYGLRQAPRTFNQHLDGSLKHMGFIKSDLDPCVYHYRNGDTISYAAVVVDDILLCTNSKTHPSDFAETLSTTYELSQMGSPEWIIGLRVQRKGQVICLNQERYITDIATRFGQLDCRPVATPADSNVNLRDFEEPRLDTTKYDYLSLVGSLMWSVLTRPDVAAAVSGVAQFTSNPTPAHWKAAIRVLRYLYHTKSLGLVYNGLDIKQPCVHAYADAAWGNERKRRSRYGFVCLMGNSPIAWVSKVSSMVCLSTAEAEFVAATEASKELVWFRNFLIELGFPQNNPAVLHEDNQATIRMASNPVVSARNRHFSIKMHWIREQVANDIVTLQYVSTKDQLADILTKSQPKPLFLTNRNKLVGNTNIVSSIAGEC